MDKRAEKLLLQPTLTVSEFAELMGLSTGACYQFVERGEIKVLRFGRRIVIPTMYARKLLGLN